MYIKFTHFMTLIVGLFLSTASIANDQSISATMYKPLNCGCCDVYANYLEDNGFKVEVNSISYDALKSIKIESGVPEHLEGCHTLKVGGYIVDGLVSVETIHKLLNEKPKILGISLPGMPVGAPGMPGNKVEPLTVYEFTINNEEIYVVD